MNPSGDRREPGVTARPNGVGASSETSTHSSRKDTIQSFQDVIFESMEEAHRMRRSRIDEKPEFFTTSVFVDTVKDIKSAASGTLASIQDWAHKKSEPTQSRPSLVLSQDDEVMGSLLRQNDCHSPSSDRIAASGAMKRFVGDDSSHMSAQSLLQDLAWPFAVCGIEVTKNLPEERDLTPHLKRVKDAVTKAVNGDIVVANDIWKFASPTSPDDDDDQNTIETFDTFQEENNQIRRLGSWGTVNTTGTNGTSDTGFNSLDSLRTPMEIRIGIEDDDGNIIDPLLLEKAQRRLERRVARREKVVKFEYPPIKSLRQCPRPDPEDLPSLFFTEHELDQIEDDRYSTMSTDDIEIVAVSSKAGDPQPVPAKCDSNRSPKAKRTTWALSEDESRQSPSPPNGRETPDPGWKQTRERPSTPYRRHRDDDLEPHVATQEPKSPGSNSRLVKGVQIYLRERSTGA